MVQGGGVDLQFGRDRLDESPGLIGTDVSSCLGRSDEPPDHRVGLHPRMPEQHSEVRPRDVTEPRDPDICAPLDRVPPVELSGVVDAGVAESSRGLHDCLGLRR